MDLEVYKLARQLSIRIFEITKRFPKKKRMPDRSDQAVIAIGRRSNCGSLGKERL